MESWGKFVVIQVCKAGLGDEKKQELWSMTAVYKKGEAIESS